MEDSGDRFAMETFEMVRVVIGPHVFFMAMYADSIALQSIHRLADGSLLATLGGSLSCATYAVTASIEVGSRDAREHGLLLIEATDGGFGPGAPPDRFVFTAFFDPVEAPINHAIFGPEAPFTGEMIAGQVWLGSPSVEEITEGLPATASPAS